MALIPGLKVSRALPKRMLKRDKSVPCVTDATTATAIKNLSHLSEYLYSSKKP